MNYVKHFNINGVDTKQVACIELQGAPNAATEGAVGLLGMDMTSPTHEVYKCVAVNGGVYTWELLSAGMSIMSAKITGEGALSATFPYSQLIIPNNYLVKYGDLILDSEGYLYRITSINTESCTAEYCNTHIGGMASGDKDRRLTINGGKLQLVTESGNVLSEVDYPLADGDTIFRNPSTGQIRVIGIETVDGTVLKLFVGTQAEYDALTDAQKSGLLRFITEDISAVDILGAIAAAVKKTGDEMSGTLTAPFVTIKKEKYPAISFKNAEGKTFAGMAVNTDAKPHCLYIDTFKYNGDTIQFDERFNFPQPTVKGGRYNVLTTKTDVEGATAGYDLSKGTIEERLTALGFKQGAVNVLSGGTVSTNNLYKQGKYVYGDLVIDFTSRPEGYYSSANINDYHLLGNLPTGFSPKTSHNYRVVADLPGGSTQDLKVDIATNGNIYMTGHHGIIYKIYIHLGYETM